MYPSCEMVEYATTRLMSFCTRAMLAAKTAVSAPTVATRFMLIGARLNRAFDRATMYTPAVTMVAAWIRAETGVGPSMASGSQTYSGSWADLPVAPMKSRIVIQVTRDSPKTESRSRISRIASAWGKISAYATDPNVRQIRNRPSRNPASPIRLTTNAFLPASAADFFWYQKPMRR